MLLLPQPLQHGCQSACSHEFRPRAARFAAEAEAEAGGGIVSGAVHERQAMTAVEAKLRAEIFERWEKTTPRLRAIQLKKRTCSMCGKTAPNTTRSFAYCGGCRHSSIPRADRPRFCSEECQRAHWLAGHVHECPRTHEE